MVKKIDLFSLARINNLKGEQTLNKVPTQSLSAPKKTLRLGGKIKKQIYRTELEMSRLKSAIAYAENTFTPNRQLLYAIYKEVAKDDEVFTHTRNSKIKVVSAPFELRKNKTKDHKATELLEKPWFSKYLEYFVDTVFWGHSLVEFQEMPKGSSEFEDIKLIPREHVQPWAKRATFMPNGTEGINYLEKPWSSFMIEMGDEEDLGIFLIVAKLAILKNYSVTDWSRSSEKFGMPLLAIKTNSRDEAELDEKARMAQSFGSNGWVILDDEDSIDLIETSKSDFYKIYAEFLSRNDRQIAKVISGQTGTTEEKSFVGSAEVHERLYDDIILSILRKLQDHINYELLPLLIDNGYPLQGCKFAFADLDTKPSPTPSPAPLPQQPSPEKKKLNLGCGCAAKPSIKLSAKELLDIEKLLDAALEAVFNGELSNGLHIPTYRYNLKKLYKGINEGFGVAYSKLDDSDSRKALATRLRANARSFAAFKNHSNMVELTKAMVGADEEIKTFAQFKEDAAPIYTNYNTTWLEAEYNSAVASTQMAEKWESIQQDKDIFPLLVYDAVMDDNVRPAHAELNGTTLPVDHPFWERFYPANGWGCRCTVRQLTEGEIVLPKVALTEEAVPAAFRNNPGITGQLFSDAHDYYSVSDQQRKDILEAINSL
jgi:SPP1 gp7 family putative phage head morphogenesis protein